MAPTPTSSGVNKQPDPCCATCGQANEMDHTIQCEECKRWIHYVCSALPVYILLCLARTHRKYTCEKCCYEKYADPVWTAEAVEAIKRQKHSTITKEQPSDLQAIPTPPEHSGPSQPREQTDSSLDPLQETTATEPQIQDSSPQSHPTSHNPSLQEENVSTGGNSNTVGLGDSPENIDLSQLGETQDQTNITTHRTHQETQGGQTAEDNTKRLLPKVATICKFYRNGNCRYGRIGKSCRYQHPKCCQRLLNHGPHSNQGCKLKNRCPQFHPTLCRSSVSRGVCFRQSCTLAHIRGTKFTRDQQASQTERNIPQGPGAAGNLGDRKGNQELPSQSADPNSAFLGVMTEVTARLDSLTKAMEAQASMITNIIGQKQIGPTPPPPPIWLNPVTPWLNAPNSH